MPAEIVKATLTGGKVDGKVFQQDVNVPDPGFAASQVAIDVTWALMDAYPTVMPPVDPDKLQAAQPQQLTVRLPNGQTLKVNWQDYLWWIQQLPVFLAMIAQVQSGNIPPEGIASPIVPVTLYSHPYNFYAVLKQRTAGLAATAAAPGTEKNSAKPDPDKR